MRRIVSKVLDREEQGMSCVKQGSRQGESRWQKFKKEVCPKMWGKAPAVIVALGVMVMTVMMPTTCFAASTGTAAITQPLENLKTLVIAVIAAVGVIILAKNVMEFAQAYQQQDSATMNSALKGIVAGAMMAGISAVLAFLGF